MINTVILDIGNVLAGFDYIGYMKEKGYENNLIKRLSRVTVENILWREIDRSNSDTIDEAIIAKFVNEDPEIADDIRKFLLNSYEIVRNMTMPLILYAE